LFGGADIANLDGEFVDCGHLLMPFTTVKGIKVFTYPENYTNKTPMYFEKIYGNKFQNSNRKNINGYGDKLNSNICGMTMKKTSYPISRPFAL